MTNFLTRIKIASLSIIFALLAASCQKPDYKEIKINRFDLEASKFSEMSEPERDAFCNKYAEVIDLYINNIYPDSSISVSAKLENFTNSNATKYFEKDVAERFKTLSSLEKALTHQASKFKEELGESYPTICTAIIAYNQSIILNDSTAIIGLNHYLGKDYPAYEAFPEYKRQFKIPERIQYELAEAVLKTKYPYSPSDNTLLEKMLYEGIIAANASTLIDDFDSRNYFCFTQEQYEWCRDNEKKLWNQLLIDDTLYSTSEVLHATYLNPAPFTQPFTQDSPGMVCRLLGLKIINAYTSANNCTPAQCLTNCIYKESQKILINSGYNGK